MDERAVGLAVFGGGMGGPSMGQRERGVLWYKKI
jgi:hypothetical protein